jgi:hypothetical protein
LGKKGAVSEFGLREIGSIGKGKHPKQGIFLRFVLTWESL